MGKVYVLRKSAEKHSRNMLLFSTIIIGSVFGLAACNNDNNDDINDTTPMEDNNGINNNGVNDNGVNDNGGVINDDNGVDDGVLDNGVEDNGQSDLNNETMNKSNHDDGVIENKDSFKDEAEKAIDGTEDAIRGEDGNKKPE